MIGYGLVDSNDVEKMVVSVCDVLGHGSNGNAAQFMMEICAQETHLGQFRDCSPISHGVGLCQIDKICFDDVMLRTRDYKSWDHIDSEFGIVRDSISYQMLAYSPLLSLIFCRLFLRLIPDEFPETRKERAEYWKKYYNTCSGKGTTEEFMRSCRRLLPEAE